MKKQLLLFAMILLPLVASAHDIEVKNADGITIYYNYINNSTELEVTFRGDRYGSYSNEYQGYIVIPEEVTYMNRTRKVTSIGSSAFYECSSLTSVTIGNSVTSIGDYAFYNSGLTSVTIPNSVTSIGWHAFDGCSGLTSVTIPNSVTSIGDYAFKYCSGLTSVTIPNSVRSIGGHAFQYCSGLTSFSIGNSVRSIGGHAFDGCKNLTSVTIPNSVTSIGVYAFWNCFGLKKVIVKDIVAWCGIKFGGSDSNPLFSAHHLYSDENTEITNLIIPNSVTSIGDDAFSRCSGLTSVTIHNSVTSIGDDAFDGCYGLTSITIGSGINYIGKTAFASCFELTDVTCYAENVPFTYTDAFKDSFIEYATLHVPASAVNAYKEAYPWVNFKSIIEANSTGIKTIENTQIKNTTIYDMNGVRLSVPKKGINIINGKKVVIK